MAGHSIQANKEHFKQVKKDPDKEDEVGISSGYMDNQERRKFKRNMKKMF